MANHPRELVFTANLLMLRASISYSPVSWYDRITQATPAEGDSTVKKLQAAKLLLGLLTVNLKS